MHFVSLGQRFGWIASAALLLAACGGDRDGGSDPIAQGDLPPGSSMEGEFGDDVPRGDVAGEPTDAPAPIEAPAPGH